MLLPLLKQVPSLLGWLAFLALACDPALAAGELAGATLVAARGTNVFLSRAGASAWDPAPPNAVLQPGDRLRTGEFCHAILRLRDATQVTVSELTTLEISGDGGRSVLDVLKGVLSIFHRTRPGDVEVRGCGTSALVRGTEFVVSVQEARSFSLSLFDGEVELGNDAGAVRAITGDFVHATPGVRPVRTPGLVSTNRSAIQWVIAYPLALDPADLPASLAGAARWQPVLDAYRDGDPARALQQSLSLGEPVSDAERVLLGALRLPAGDVEGFRRLVASITPGSREATLAAALEDVVKASQFEARAARVEGRLDTAGKRWTTTEWLAASFVFQSLGRLEEARQAAAQAVAQSPRFGPAQVRLAELEFSQGRVPAARACLERGLAASPRHAAALALDGFLLAAENRFREARDRFEHSLELDPGLADAWLGRGLIRLRTGDTAGGRFDLETAAALDPFRSILRSYLGKAFAEERDGIRAASELELARRLDPLDPTPWLYGALLEYRQYGVARAIADLERSARLNDNRSIYRSRLLLDQDAAVRSANLANIYELADMADVSRRESARAVMYDYANASAHLNLAGSYNALRDPTRFNLHNETVWFNEHLLASLLAPASSAPLSQNLSQNEYSRLFARDTVGINGTTEYFSSGEYRQLASQYGNFSRLSYALDLDHAQKPGLRPNEDLSRTEWYTRAKAELGPRDSVLLLTKYQDFESGDEFQYTDPHQARPDYRFSEKQAPMVLGGYHREWSPGSHTLLLGGRLENDQKLSDFAAPQLIAFSNPPGPPASAAMDLRYRSGFETYTAEAAHILQSAAHVTVLGGRWQDGRFQARSVFDATPSTYPEVFGTLVPTSGDGVFGRRSAYAYHTWELVPDLRFTGGLSYDALQAPANFRRPPLSPGEETRSGWSPKLALIWSLLPSTTLRAAYAESLGGVSYDESIRLEPTQLAGFPQAFRTLASESLVGSVEMPRHRVAGLGLDFHWPTRTYLGVEGRWLQGDVEQQMGYFDFDAFRPSPEALPGQTSRQLDYRERGLRVVANQILAEEWFAQALYELTGSELEVALPLLPADPGYARSVSERSTLHRTSASLLYQRTDGWFGRVVVAWNHQENSGDLEDSHDDFTLLNLFAGYRLPRHLGDITLGLLNVTDRPVRLYPLTPFEEPPRARMLYVRIRFGL